eukprot:TRINITY_DN3306_c0_g1_i1.p1 TRINITY_DN3306_c0_g1~~TRINITY_DN3306_c0_g1_i1.p1  ORF type:complete len:1268 (+),score=209.40 TRINITY_DN3306_c0_g1_i1:32-3805(+)
MAYYLRLAGNGAEHFTKPCPHHTQKPSWDGEVYEFDVRKLAFLPMTAALGRGNDILVKVDFNFELGSLQMDSPLTFQESNGIFEVELVVRKVTKKMKGIKAGSKDRRKSRSPAAAEKKSARRLSGGSNGDFLDFSPIPRSAKKTVAGKVERQKKRLSIRLGISTGGHKDRDPEATSTSSLSHSHSHSHTPKTVVTDIAKDKDRDPKQLVVELGKRPGHDFFEKLILTVKSEEMSWITAFCDLVSIPMMVVPLNHRLETPYLHDSDVKYIVSILNVLTSIMSDAEGFGLALNCRETPKVLLMLLARPELHTPFKKKIVRVATFGITLESRYFKLFLSAIKESGQSTFQNPAEAPRFLYLLSEIDETRDLEYKALLVGFFYEMVTLPNNLSQRISLRHELNSIGMQELLEELAGISVLDLGLDLPLARLTSILSLVVYQVNRYRDAEKRDEELRLRLRFRHVLGVDRSSPKQIFAQLEESANSAQLQDLLTLILQDLLAINLSDRTNAYQQWFVIRQIVGEVTTQSLSDDPVEEANSGNGVVPADRKINHILRLLLTSAPNNELLEEVIQENHLLLRRNEVLNSIVELLQNRLEDSNSLLVSSFSAIADRELLSVQSILQDCDALLSTSSAGSQKRLGRKKGLGSPNDPAFVAAQESPLLDPEQHTLPLADYRELTFTAATADLFDAVGTIVNRSGKPKPFTVFEELESLRKLVSSLLRQKKHLLALPASVPEGKKGHPEIAAEVVDAIETEDDDEALLNGLEATEDVASVEVPNLPVAPQPDIHVPRPASPVLRRVREAKRKGQKGARMSTVPSLKFHQRVHGDGPKSPHGGKGYELVVVKGLSKADYLATLPPLNWVPMSKDEIAHSFFSHPSSSVTEPIVIDYARLSEMFGHPQHSLDPATPKSPSSSSSSTPPGPDITHRSILHPVLSTQLSHILTALRSVATSRVCEDIMNFDRRSLSLPILSALLKCYPTGVSMRHYAEFTKHHSVTLLDPPSMFALELHQIPDSLSRAKTLHFDLHFRQEILAIRSDIISLQQAARCLIGESCIPVLLTVILDYGNAVNRNEPWISNLRGYDLQSILLLSNSPSRDGTTTLLQYLLGCVVSQQPDLLSFTPSLRRTLSDVVHCNLDDLERRLDSLAVSFKEAQAIARRVRSTGPKDTFHSNVTNRWEVIAEELVTATKALQATVVDSGKVRQYFGQHSTPVTIGEFYSLFHQLLVQFDLVSNNVYLEQVTEKQESVDEFYKDLQRRQEGNTK